MTSFALRHYQHATPPVSALRIMTRHDLWRMSILGATPSMLRGNAADDYVVRSGNLRCLRSHVPDNILWKSDILNLKANKRQSTGCVNARSCSKQQREGQHCTWKRCRKRPSQQTTGKSCHTEMFEGCDFLLPQTTCTSIFQLHADRTNPSFSCCSHLRGQLWFQDQRVLTFPLNYSHSVSTSVPKLHGLSQPLSAFRTTPRQHGRAVDVLRGKRSQERLSFSQAREPCLKLLQVVLIFVRELQVFASLRTVTKLQAYQT